MSGQIDNAAVLEILIWVVRQMKDWNDTLRKSERY